ncbi:MAG: hypothetical protein JNK49_19275 [Planctomycetes bacterium]|nr:hypothetical protein [Planctomycetota bacterium]
MTKTLQRGPERGNPAAEGGDTAVARPAADASRDLVPGSCRRPRHLPALMAQPTAASAVRRGAASFVGVAVTLGAVLAASAPTAQDPPPQDPPAGGQAGANAGPGTSAGGPGAGQGGTQGGGAPRADEAWLRGVLTTRYWARWNDRTSDHDLLSFLSVDFGRAERDAISGHFSGRLAYDLDGYDQTFASINDARGGRLDAWVYDAFADLNQIPGFERIRIGRQWTQDTPVFLWFDGIHATTAPVGSVALQAGGYAGSATHLYESSKSGDLITGGYAQLRPWQGARVRADFVHLEGDARFGSQTNELLGAGYWQSFGQRAEFDGQYTRLDNEDRDARGRLTFRVREWDLLVRGSYYRLLRSQRDLVVELDPYFQALNALFPYDQWSMLVAKDIAQKVRVQASADLRRVDDQDDVGFFNRDYDHYAGTATLLDLGVKGLTLSGSIDLWDASAQTTKTWGGDLAYEFDKSTVALGSYYSLYKYDVIMNVERTSVRTYYVRVRHKFDAATSVDADYEFEDTSLIRNHRIRLGVTWRF